MPTLPAANHVLRCTYTGTFGASKWVNVFHAQYAGGPISQSDIDSVTAALSSAWNTSLGPLISTSATLQHTTAQDLTSLTGVQSDNATSHAGSAVATQIAPANVALVLSFKIARRYRGGHPRMYLTGQLTTQMQNQNAWLPTYVTTATTNANAWITAVNAITTTSITTLALCNLSYKSGGAVRPVPVVDLISRAVVHGRVDTMRRRLGKELP